MIEVKNISKSYGKVQAVTGVSFEVKKGEILGFVGPNGAGKSTTMRILTGMEPGDKGQCLIDGTEVSKLPDPLATFGCLLDRQGIIPQISAQTAIEAVGAAYGVPKSRSMRLLEMVDLLKDKERKVGDFSLGMKQRLGLAMAMLAEPEYLILDEPMNGLDPDGIIWLRDLLRAFAKKGGGVLLSSHTLAEVEELADRITIIKKGSIIWTGTKAEVWGSSAKVQVSTNDNKGFLKLCQAKGINAEEHGEMIYIIDMSIEEVSALVVENGFVPLLLSKTKKNLESMYLELTKQG